MGDAVGASAEARGPRRRTAAAEAGRGGGGGGAWRGAEVAAPQVVTSGAGARRRLLGAGVVPPWARAGRDRQPRAGGSGARRVAALQTALEAELGARAAAWRELDEGKARCNRGWRAGGRRGGGVGGGARAAAPHGS